MPNRREFISVAAMGVSGALGHLARLDEEPKRHNSDLEGIVFDAMALFDPRPVAQLAESLFSGRGGDLIREWRTRQFEYTWLRATSHQYTDFWHVTEEALEFAAEMLGLRLSSSKRNELMGAYLKLMSWPDVAPTLHRLQRTGFRLAVLSNFTPAMLRAAIENSRLAAVFEHVISTDEAKTYKPDPKAYQLACRGLGLQPTQILYVAFAGWDAAGAKWFGYPTFWLNREQRSAERLEVSADRAGTTMADLDRFVGQRSHGGAIPALDRFEE